MPKWLQTTLIIAGAALAIGMIVLTAGAAAAGAGFIAGLYASSLSLGAYTAITAAATIGTYIAAGVVIAGISAFAVADIQQTWTGDNYLGFLGSSYDTVKGGFYAASLAFPLLGQFAPVSYISTEKDTGNYILRDKDNKVRYVGVGDENRMRVSINRIQREFGVTTTGTYYSAESREMAFACDAIYINEFGGPMSMGGSLFNKINSPGLKRLFWWF